MSSIRAGTMTLLYSYQVLASHVTSGTPQVARRSARLAPLRVPLAPLAPPFLPSPPPALPHILIASLCWRPSLPPGMVKP